MCFVTDANGWKVLVLSRSSTAFWLMPTNLLKNWFFVFCFCVKPGYYYFSWIFCVCFGDRLLLTRIRRAMNIVTAVKQQKMSILDFFQEEKSSAPRRYKLLRNISLQQIQYSRKKHESQSSFTKNLYASHVSFLLTYSIKKIIFFCSKKSNLLSFLNKKGSLETSYLYGRSIIARKAF